MNTDYVKYNQASYTASYLMERDHISSAERTELSSVRLLFKSQDLTWQKEISFTFMYNIQHRYSMFTAQTKYEVQDFKY